MTAIEIGLSSILVTAFGFVVYKAMTLNRQVAGDVFTDDKSKANYGKHKGPVDDGLNDRIRRLVYEKHGYVCKITGRSGFPGDADTNGEHLLVGIGARVELQIGHIIAHRLAGPTELWNLVPMEKKLNIRLKDKITPMAEALCRRRGEKIWTGGGIKKTTFAAEKEKLAQSKRSRRIKS